MATQQPPVPTNHKLYASEDIASINIARNIGSVKGWHVTGDYITIGTSNDASVYIYDISLLENPNKALKTVIRSPFNHTNITSVFFDPELQAVFVSYDNHCVCIFNVHSNEKIGQIRGVNCKHLFVLNHQLLVAHVVETQHSTSTTLTTTGTATTLTTTTSKLRSNTFMNTQHSNNNHTQPHSTRQHFIQIWNISSQHNSIQCSLKYSTQSNNNTWNSHPHIMEIFQVSPHTIYLDGNVKKEMQVIVCGFGNSSSSGGGSDEGGILVLYDLLNQSESVKSLIFHTNNNNTNSNNISHKGVYCYSIDQDRDSLDDLCICGLNDGTIMEFNLTQMNPQLEPRILNTTSNSNSSNSNSNSSSSSITLNVNTHQSIECLAFDGALMRIASGGCEGSICVWEVMSSSTQTNTIHTINTTTTTTDVNSINTINTSNNKIQNVVDHAHMKCIKSHLNIHDGFVTCMTQCEDKIATGSQDGTIKVFDKMDGHLIGNLDQKHTSCITHLDFIESHLLLSSSEDGTLKLHILT